MTSGPSAPRSVGSHRVLRTLQALGAVMVVAAVVLLLARPYGGGSDARAAARSPSEADGQQSSGAETAPAPAASQDARTRGGARSVPAPAASARPIARALQPVRITIPAIGVDSTLTDLGIAADGTIEVPSQPARAGWLTGSPAPGQRGPAIIAGHVDSERGPAVFYRLRELRPGDRITITRRDGVKTRFTVDGLDAYPKKRFPTEAIYGPVPGPALRLITCGGSYVKSEGGYLDNVVVFAT